LEEETLDKGLKSFRDRRSGSNYGHLLRLNLRLISPLISRFGPATAYRLNKITGLIGKTYDMHTSFLYNRPAAPAITEMLKNYLDLDDNAARRVVKTFFLYESRLEIEKIWMLENKTNRLPHIINETAIEKLAEQIRKDGPCLLLSAHTFNLFTLWWALVDRGVKFCLPAADQGSEKTSNLLHQTVRDYIAAFSKIMPVLYTNEGNTVGRCIELVKQGYSALIYLDVLGYRNRDPRVKLMGNRIGVPTGCLRIFAETGVPVKFVCTYGAGLDEPYGLMVKSLDVSSGTIDLSGWASALEEVLRMSPESWVGWLFLREMV